MENQQNVKVITLSDLWGIFVRRLWIILLVSILAVGVSFTINFFMFVPKYESAAMLYILQVNNTNNDKDYEDFNLALKVVNDCTHLIKSHSVLDEVIKNLNLDIGYNQLYKSITITNPADTRILSVVVESNSPENAKMIVDEICTVGTQKITYAMGFEQVNFYERGVLNLYPCNKTSSIIYLLIGLIVMAVTYSIFLFSYFLDDKISTDEDIKNYLNVSILGDIPNVDEAKNGKNGKYGGKYYKRKYYKQNAYRKEYR